MNYLRTQVVGLRGGLSKKTEKFDEIEMRVLHTYTFRRSLRIGNDKWKEDDLIQWEENRNLLSGTIRCAPSHLVIHYFFLSPHITHNNISVTIQISNTMRTITATDRTRNGIHVIWKDPQWFSWWMDDVLIAPSPLGNLPLQPGVKWSWNSLHNHRRWSIFFSLISLARY